MPLIQVTDHTFLGQALGSDSVVLDLGANRGEFCHRMIELFHCRCISVEANPAMCATIAPHPLLTVVNAAVAAESGTSPFYVCKHDEASSLLRPEPGAIDATIQIPSLTLDELLARYELPAVDLLKVDIEGAEIEVLGACPDELLRRIPQVTVEFHDFNARIPQAAALQVVARFRHLGFDVIKMWMRSHGYTLFVNRRLVGIGAAELAWSRWGVRNWWWAKRFVRRKLGLSR